LSQHRSKPHYDKADDKYYIYRESRQELEEKYLRKKSRSANKHKHHNKSHSKQKVSSKSKRRDKSSKPTKDDLETLKEEIRFLRMEKIKREEEFNKTNREMREIKSSLKCNQQFLLALKADMVEKNKSHRSISRSRRSLLSDERSYSRSPGLRTRREIYRK
jgi:chromosome segregation ATPase